MMNNKRLLNGMFLAALASLALSASADTHTWTGQAHDHLWSSGENWDNHAAPSGGDTVVIQKGEGDGDVSTLVVTNDVGTYLSSLKVLGDTPVVVDGAKIQFTNNSLWALECQVSATFNIAMDFLQGAGKTTTYIFLLTSKDEVSSLEYVFNGKMSCTGNGMNFYVVSDNKAAICTRASGVNSKIFFKGEVDVSNGAFCPDAFAEIYFDASLKALQIGDGAVYGTADHWRAKKLHFRCAGSHVGGWNNWRLHKSTLETVNAFDATSVLGFPAASDNIENANAFYLSGFDQTMGALTGGDNIGTKAEPYSIFSGSETSPNDAAVLTLKGVGDGAVSHARLMGNLSLVLDPTDASFTQTLAGRAHGTTGEITVRGGCLKLGGATTFTSVSSVKVEGSGTLDVSEATETVDFGAAILDLATTAKLVIPEGMTLSVGALTVNGEYVRATDYQSGALPQIEGAGTLSVKGLSGVSHWIGASDGKWSDAANWDTVVPTAAASIAKSGTYEISTADATLPSNLRLEMANPSEGTATVKLEKREAFNGAQLTIGRRSVLKTVDGAEVGFTGGTFKLCDGGTFAMAGGTAVLANLTMDGGTVEMGGSSVLTLNVANGATPFQTGTVLVEDDAKVVYDGNNYWTLNFTPNAADETCFVTFAGRSAYDGRNTKASNGVTLNNGRSGGNTILTIKDSASVNFGLGLDIAKGNGARAEMNMADQSFATKEYYGTQIGCGATDVANPSHGILRVSGGTFENKTQVMANNDERVGIVIGDGSQVETDGYANIGEVFLSGGAIDCLQNGVLVVGVGSGRGRVVQSGGTLTHGTWYPVVIGLRGGLGEYLMTGGQTTVTHADVYVGGCPTNVVTTYDVFVCNYKKLPTDKPGVGILCVSGGVFQVDAAATVHVSAAGCGEIRVAGGELNAGKLVLGASDDAVSGNRQVSKLVFSVGPNGEHGIVNVSGSLTIADGTKLEINLGDFEGPKVKLLEAASVTGTFADSDVIVTGKHADKAKWSFRNGVLRCGVPQGLSIVVR